MYTYIYIYILRSLTGGSARAGSTTSRGTTAVFLLKIPNFSIEILDRPDPVWKLSINYVPISCIFTGSNVTDQTRCRMR